MNNSYDAEKVSHPLFISFEGGEGAGKTTLLQSIAHQLRSSGYGVVVTREPGGSKLGDYIRQWLLNKEFDFTIGMKSELLLFLAARAQHIEERIQPALSAGKIVLCDRFNDSTVAYQGYARGLGAEEVQAMCQLVCGSVTPQLTFFLDVDPQVGLRRTKHSHKENAAAGEMDRIESEGLKFHELVRQGFHWIAKQEPDRFTVIDANQAKAAVYEQALAHVKAKLEKR